MQIKKFEYPNKLNKIFDKLNNLNLKSLIVGGYIRDFYLGKNSKDIDIEVYGLDTIEQLIPLLAEFGKVYEAGKSFGVCKLSLDGLDLDFSMPRTDNKVSTGHKGFEIRTKKDLDYKTAASRRDFTINTIAYDTKSKKLLDPYNGLSDLKKKLLKIVDKKSFIEDPLRVFRAVGMIARFNLKVDDETIKLCEFMINKGMLKELSKERIYEELKKLFLKSKKPSLGLVFFKQINGLAFFNELNLEDELWRDTMDSLDRFAGKTKELKLTNNKTNIKLSLVLLCYKLDDAKSISFIRKITNEKNIDFEILELIINVNFLIERSDTYSLRKIATKVSFLEVFEITDALNIDTKKKKEKVKNLKIMTNPMPRFIQGKDLVNIGLIPSPIFSKILNLAYDKQLNSKFDNKDDALIWLKNYLS